MEIKEEVIKEILKNIQNIGQTNSLERTKNDFSLSEEDMEEYLNYCEKENLITAQPLISRNTKVISENIRYEYIITYNGKKY